MGAPAKQPRSCERLAEQDRGGWHLLRWHTAALAVLAIALILAAFDVPGAAAVAFVAFIGVCVLAFVGPWLPSRGARDKKRATHSR